MNTSDPNAIASGCYILKITDEGGSKYEKYYSVDVRKRFLPSYGPVKLGRAFQLCLEEHLHEMGGKSFLPFENAPWIFYKVDSTEGEPSELALRGEVVVTLHTGNKDILWELHKWLNGPVTGCVVQVDY